MTGKISFTAASACFLAFSASAAPALASLSIEPETAKQGQTVVVRITGDGTASGAPTVSFNGRTFKTFPVDTEGTGTYRALICMPALLKPGSYNISAGNDSAPIKVTAGNFGIQRIRLPKSKDNFDGSPGERKTVDAAKATVSDTQEWQGKFQHPCKARISSAYGLRRAVNGRLLADYFHSGVDFAGPTGTPVQAVQKGKVLIAHTGWKLHGNTVCIDHGQGVLSFYIHLSKIFVKEGQRVETGDKIGAIGATGRASGPHLHFSVYVNNDATNPGDWFNKGF
ncbi:MAG: M23 family metallopeptidase [Candidatus Obscuribacterales bacterium]|nr:M23 family metallopeptidase [Candidatus Obscuribacterales bacterium]